MDSNPWWGRRRRRTGQRRVACYSSQPANSSLRATWLRLVCSILVVTVWPLITVSNKISLQNQLQNPALVTLKNLMRSLTARLEDGYCSITVANHRLVTVIRFVAKSCTHPWKGFANRLHLVHHTCEILFSENMCARILAWSKQGLVWLRAPFLDS